MAQDPMTYAEVGISDARTLPVQRSVKNIVGFSVVLSLLFAGAGFCVGYIAFHRPAVREISSQDNLQQLATVESGQWSWQIVGKERDLCASLKDNCISSKCCAISGYHCFAKDDTVAKCMKTCVPGKDGLCKPLGVPIVLEATTPARSLYCFSVYTANIGSAKKSYEKELLSEQFEKKVSIFACDAYSVYSDVEVSLGPGLVTKKVDDVDNEFHFAKRKATGTWVNTGSFIQVWKAIGEEKTYMQYEWVVKVDADAVFVPERLRDRIQWMPRTVSGTILQNCKFVNYGFFGNLEVYSHMAFSILLANLNTCRATIPWKIGVEHGKYGPMGEDLFAEICLTKNGVDKVEAFDATTDGACPADRPLDQKANKKWKPDCNRKTPAMHPFKKPVDYFKCLDQTMAMDESGDLATRSKIIVG